MNLTAETVNQAYKVISDASQLLSALLNQPVELRVISPELPDRNNLKQAADKADAALLKAMIIDYVARQYMLSLVALRSKSRKQEVVDARKTAAHLLTNYVTGIRDKEIATALNFDRTSVWANVRRCEELLLTNKTFKYNYNQVLKQLKGSL